MALSAPPELERLQRALRDVFCDPRGARAAAAARPQALGAVRDDARCSAATRLSVYGDGYFLRMLEALSLDYPAVLRGTGTGDFRALVAEYITAHPSTSPSLADLGELFPDFVAGHRFGARLPWLADLARLERAVSESLLCDRLPALSDRDLAAIPTDAWDGVRLRLDPAARLIETAWPVLAFWRGARRTPSSPRAQRLLAARGERGVKVRILAKAEGAVLQRLQNRQPLGRALRGVGEGPAKIQAWFSAWMAHGLIAGILN